MVLLHVAVRELLGQVETVNARACSDNSGRERGLLGKKTQYRTKTLLFFLPTQIDYSYLAFNYSATGNSIAGLSYLIKFIFLPETHDYFRFYQRFTILTVQRRSLLTMR